MNKEVANTTFQMSPIGTVHSCFKEKFGIPRQPGLVPDARATIVIHPPYDRDEAFRGLEQVSHIWLVFVFHQSMRNEWKPMVRPPRLGGNEKVGVFATRSNFRPNPVGLSLVELISFERVGQQLLLHIKGGDLVEGTPILDIKPYLVYADSMPGAINTIAESAPDKIPVIFSAAAKQELEPQQQRYPDIEPLIKSVLELDPRPAYKARKDDDHIYGCHLYDLNIRWQLQQDHILVINIEQLAE
ncbi:MAG: tRNA (N6-threonylcarbamoyladenosine(37)-N6)-methyltransferase TrmO [Gammaproteobacteria bacterium]|nr:tRNA (N6-threonylcarbamoyladenosine(37)-N6)-methyltransferase TrmO [Gammaproteobacteria bacterium]